jgi:hypothetical protein
LPQLAGGATHTGVLPIPGAFAKQREILKAAAAPLQSIVYATYGPMDALGNYIR